jgi:hypothetical protein
MNILGVSAGLTVHLSGGVLNPVSMQIGISTHHERGSYAPFSGIMTFCLPKY